MKEFKIKINGNDYSVSVSGIEENIAQVEVNGTPFSVEVEGLVSKAVARTVSRPVSRLDSSVAKPTAPVAVPSAPAAAASPSAGGAIAIQSPLPGIVIDINVKVGDMVKTGQKILVLEAMKMENNINADRDGKVVEIKVGKGDSVLEGADLIIIG